MLKILPYQEKLITLHCQSERKASQHYSTTLKHYSIIEKLNFTSNELIKSLTFTEDDFNKAAGEKRISISFKEFIQDIMGYCQKDSLTLDDAILLAEDNFDGLAKKSYDVCFDNETRSNDEGWYETYEYCKNYIECNNGTNEGYFADYKGGLVSIYCNETGKTVYCEKVK